jgi:hypothetical protein
MKSTPDKPTSLEEKLAASQDENKALSQKVSELMESNCDFYFRETKKKAELSMLSDYQKLILR